MPFDNTWSLTKKLRTCIHHSLMFLQLKGLRRWRPYERFQLTRSLWRKCTFLYFFHRSISLSTWYGSWTLLPSEVLDIEPGEMRGISSLLGDWREAWVQSTRTSPMRNKSSCLSGIRPFSSVNLLERGISLIYVPLSLLKIIYMYIWWLYGKPDLLRQINPSYRKAHNIINLKYQ